LQWSAGAARQKLEDEIAQVAGQPRPLELPDISYKVFSTHNEADTTVYDLMLTIEEKDAPSFTRELLVSQALISDDLKIVDYQFVK